MLSSSWLCLLFSRSLLPTLLAGRRGEWDLVALAREQPRAFRPRRRELPASDAVQHPSLGQRCPRGDSDPLPVPGEPEGRKGGAQHLALGLGGFWGPWCPEASGKYWGARQPCVPRARPHELRPCPPWRTSHCPAQPPPCTPWLPSG